MGPHRVVTSQFLPIAFVDMKKKVFAAMLAASLLTGVSVARAEFVYPGFIEATHLLELTQGTELSRLVSGVSGGGFESAAGSSVRFDKWYSSKWVDSRITFMTQVSANLGVLWGFSTGERGEKYTIDPALKLGFIYRHPVTRSSAFSFSASTILGGRLHEKSCVADYGQIGGVQEVNCRLAASTLQPSETLNYMFNQNAYNRNSVQLRYSHEF